jgi:hypothetical protein
MPLRYLFSAWLLELHRKREIKDRDEPSRDYEQTQADYGYLFKRVHRRAESPLG